MNYNIVVVTAIIIVVLITEFLINIINSKSESSTSGAMIATGITLIVTAFPSIIDSLVNLLGFALGTDVITSNGVNGVSIVCGGLLIVFGFIYEKNIRDRIFVLNMFGIYSQFEISEKKNISDLKLSDFKLKEITVDFVDIFKSGITESTNEIITKKIEKECLKFVERSRDFKSCYTGMAPIPYTILAGTYLANSKVERYFEYRRSENKYYELAKKAKRHYPELKKEYPENERLESENIVVSISITRTVQEHDMNQFRDTDVIKLYVDNPEDNLIKSREQLNDYKIKIIDCLEEIKVKYCKVKKIHLLASIPSCISLEIGKMIALNGNRIPQIISYHYVNSETPKYPFGIIVTENFSDNEKGKLVRS